MRRIRVSLTVAGVAACLVGGPALAQANPSEFKTTAARNRGPCVDPWVTLAQDLVFGSADAARCKIELYNGGRWNSFADLVSAMRGVKVAFDAAGMDMRATRIEGTDKNAVGIYLNGTLAAVGASDLVGAGAGNLVGAGAGNLVGAGAGNLVGAGAGNITMYVKDGKLVGAGAGNLIGMNGASLLGVATAVDLPRGYRLQNARSVNVPGRPITILNPR